MFGSDIWTSIMWNIVKSRRVSCWVFILYFCKTCKKMSIKIYLFSYISPYFKLCLYDPIYKLCFGRNWSIRTCLSKYFWLPGFLVVVSICCRYDRLPWYQSVSLLYSSHCIEFTEKIVYRKIDCSNVSSNVNVFLFSIFMNWSIKHVLSKQKKKKKRAFYIKSISL